MYPAPPASLSLSPSLAPAPSLLPPRPLFLSRQSRAGMADKEDAGAPAPAAAEGTHDLTAVVQTLLTQMVRKIHCLFAPLFIVLLLVGGRGAPGRRAGRRAPCCAGGGGRLRGCVRPGAGGACALVHGNRARRQRRGAFRRLAWRRPRLARLGGRCTVLWGRRAAAGGERAREHGRGRRGDIGKQAATGCRSSSSVLFAWLSGRLPGSRCNAHV